jgi:hypothetical protein
VDDEEIRLIGVEAGGEGVETDKHAATLTKGSPGVLHGSFSYLLQDSEGQIIDPHSISAGYASLKFMAEIHFISAKRCNRPSHGKPCCFTPGFVEKGMNRSKTVQFPAICAGCVSLESQSGVLFSGSRQSAQGACPLKVNLEFCFLA